ncbi:MAG TPA: DNRLRE domain-containing protein [Gaiellaceae bacterium]|nr:DNRLRE domain-containing protein [Gaiellaceae bacterium]
MRALPSLLGCLVLAAAGANAIAFAASLPTVSEKVTTASVAATIAPATCALAASADTYADQNLLNKDANFGTATILNVGSLQTVALTSENKRAFVRFNVASCGIPAGARVKTASLDLYLGTAPAASRIYDVHRIVGDWTETGLTWTAQPGRAATATGSFTAAVVGSRSTDVKSDVSSFVSGTPNYGWVVKDRNEDSSTSYQGGLNAREAASQRPALVIGYYP